MRERGVIECVLCAAARTARSLNQHPGQEPVTPSAPRARPRTTRAARGPPTRSARRTRTAGTSAGRTPCARGGAARRRSAAPSGASSTPGSRQPPAVLYTHPVSLAGRRTPISAASGAVGARGRTRARASSLGSREGSRAMHRAAQSRTTRSAFAHTEVEVNDVLRAPSAPPRSPLRRFGSERPRGCSCISLQPSRVRPAHASAAARRARDPKRGPARPPTCAAAQRVRLRLHVFGIRCLRGSAPVGPTHGRPQGVGATIRGRRERTTAGRGAPGHVRRRAEVWRTSSLSFAGLRLWGLWSLIWRVYSAEFPQSYPMPRHECVLSVLSVAAANGRFAQSRGTEGGRARGG